MAFPESIRLRGLPAGVPSGALGWLLQRKGRVAITYEGFGMWPAVDTGADLPVEPLEGDCLIAGDLVVMRREGDRLGVRRILGPPGEDGWPAALDADPGSRRPLSREDCLGRVEGTRSALAGRLHRYSSPLLRCLAELRRVLAMEPSSWSDQAATVRWKYEGQAETYFATEPQEPSPLVRAFLSRQAAGRRVLVVGCGTGTDLRALLDMGHRPFGIDFSPGMVELARRRIQGTGAQVERMDVRRLRFEPGRFDGVFFTPEVYSFLPGMEARIAVLRTLHRTLSSGGFLLLSARRYKTPWEWLLSRLYLAVHGGKPGGPREAGDWFTTFAISRGGLGSSYVHLFSSRQVAAELRRGGFARIANQEDVWTAWRQ